MQPRPQYLRKTIWCLALVIGVQVLKKYLDHAAPGSLIFHHFLLTMVQIAILMWTIILLLFPSLSFIRKGLLLIAFFTLPELLFTYWIHQPEKMPALFNAAFITYATQAETNIIQYNPESSVYNDSLFYTLRPSARFLYANPEFADSFFTNRLGLRDDEASLDKPAIICLGDSHGMGWGVPQHETFAELLAATTGKKTLNAAISSYGTARELKNLYRLDTSALQYIILQYCRNDLRENREFVENNYSLPISSKERYDSLLNDHAWCKRWFPGKRFITIVKFAADKNIINPLLYPVKKIDSSAVRLRLAARYFTDILLHSAINFQKVKVLVVDMNEMESMNNDFVDEVNGLMAMPPYKARFNNNLLMVPIADMITKEDYYFLDPHMRPSGHRKVAERLGGYISKEKGSGGRE
jgi:hypothetical protein